MAITPLPSQDLLLACFTYDPRTGQLCWRARPCSHFVNARVATAWNTKHAGKEAGNRSSVNGYVTVTFGRKLLKAHRIIWKIITGRDPDQVDHINRDRSDNRWVNLRNCSLQENLLNNRRYKNNKSGFKGVSERKGRWRATIQVNRRIVTIGSFSSPHEAHAAYCTAARELHGDFASFG